MTVEQMIAGGIVITLALAWGWLMYKWATEVKNSVKDMR